MPALSRIRSTFVLLAPLIALSLGVVAQTPAPTPPPEPSLLAALALMRAKDPDGALAVLEKVVAREPSNGQAWRSLGQVHQQRKDLDRAVEAWRHALEVEPSVPTPYLSIGLAYATKQDADHAFEWLGKAKATRKIDMTQIEAAPTSTPARTAVSSRRSLAGLRATRSGSTP